MKLTDFYILSLVLLLLSSCTNEHLQEARATVAEADSMWRAGLPYADSTRLTQAYESLGQWQWCYADEYAHACYHYGKLMRAKANPVEAMQAFIAAIHSGTEDYHILGRVYSNIGSICHLASEFQLSYDMYEKSAEMFLQNGDTLLYYYDLNNMAFELAEQGKKKETETLIASIQHHCNDAHVFAKTLETKAKLYFQLQSYDSVIIIINKLQPLISFEPTSNGLKARAFWHIGNADSALYYANIVLNNLAASEQNKYNMLYIMANADSTLRNEDILSLSAQRSDLETDILIPLHNRWAMAVQVLKQDMEHNPEFQWLYEIIATILVICLLALIYILREHRQHQSLSQQVDDISAKNKNLQQKHAKIIHEIELKQVQKNKLEENIATMHKEISQLSEQQQKTYYQLLSNIEVTCSTLRSSKDILSELAWKDYSQMCEIINHHFNKLADVLKGLNLSEREIKLCVLVLINCYSDKQMADILCYGEKSIRGMKRYVAHKLGTSSAQMRVSLMNLIAQTT